MLIVDAQIHLWEKGTPSAHHRQEPSSAEQAIAGMDAAGVARALLHQPYRRHPPTPSAGYRERRLSSSGTARRSSFRTRSKRQGAPQTQILNGDRPACYGRVEIQKSAMIADPGAGIGVGACTQRKGCGWRPNRADHAIAIPGNVAISATKYCARSSLVIVVPAAWHSASAYS